MQNQPIPQARPSLPARILAVLVMMGFIGLLLIGVKEVFYSFAFMLGALHGALGFIL